MTRQPLAIAVLASLSLLAACSRDKTPSAVAPGAATVAPAAATAAAAYPTRVFFGDTHLHTALSMDAGVAGARLHAGRRLSLREGRGSHRRQRPEGQAVAPAGFPRRDRSLRPDGIRSPTSIAGKPELLANPMAKRWYDMMQAGKSAEATMELVTDVRAGQVPEGDHVQPGHAGIRRDLERHHPGGGRRQRSRASSPPSSATNGPRWSRATTCIAT